MIKKFLAALLCVFFAVPVTSDEPLGTVRVLMYHNVVPDRYAESTYEIKLSSFKSDCEYLKNNGYTVISVDYLKYCAYNKVKLPENAIMLTFDDGYLLNKTLVLPILQQYGYPATFAVVGDFTKFGKHADCTERYTYLDWEDIGDFSAQNCVTVANHSYGLHKIGQRRGAKRIQGEPYEHYRNVFENDVKKMNENFKRVGVSTDVYVYPYGLYCKESEQILTELGYNVTFTCNEGVNTIYGAQDLRLLKRYNRSDKRGNLAFLMK